MEIITVKRGDTASSLARTYGVSLDALIADNGLPADGALVEGQAIVVRFPERLYRASAALAVEDVAAETGVSAVSLYRRNILLHGAPVVPADTTLVLAYAEEPSDRRIIGGYAYPFIGETLLNTTTPFLTYLMPFTYGFKADGTLVLLDDARIVDAAFTYGATPLMHLSTLSPGGYFDAGAAAELFADPLAVQTLYDNVLTVIDEKGYGGLDVDFEYLPKEAREPYVAFIADLARRLNENGFILVTALPPKVSDGQPGLLYEGIDYAALGEVSNYAFVMTYEWGYRYGPPLPVAPLPSVRRVLDYAVSVIPREKVLLGLSNYGYDWTLPYVRGESDAPSLSTERALDLARAYGADVRFDEEAKAPYFFYTDRRGEEHVVWFEDARSFAAKLDLLLEYDLAGAFIWDLMRRDPQAFVTIGGKVNVI